MKVETLTLLGKSVLVEPVTEEKTDTGLYIQREIVPKLGKGKVIIFSQDPECEGLKVDDIVLYHKFAGRDIKISNKLYKIIPIIDVEAVLEND